MRKLVYGTLALSAALAVGFGIGGKDAGAAGDAYTFTMAGDILTIKADAAVKKIYVAPTSIAKEGDGIGYPKAPKANAWDEYTAKDLTGGSGTADSIQMDLSKYSAKKDAFFLVKKDFETDDQAVLVRVPAGLALKSASWNIGGAITINKGDNVLFGNGDGNDAKDPNVVFDISNDVKFASSSYKVDTGSSIKWQLDPATYGIYTQKGASLTLWGLSDSAAAGKKLADGSVTAGLFTVSKVNYKTIHKVKGGTDFIDFYDTPTRVGAPVKLTIPKQAEAPNITVDYVNGKITVPKNSKVDFKYDSSGTDTAMKLYGAKGGNSFSADSTDVYGSVTASALEKQTFFWLGAAGKVLKDTDKATNYVLDPDDVQKNFYIEVTGPATKTFSKSKTARTSFKKAAQTTNPAITNGVVAVPKGSTFTVANVTNEIFAKADFVKGKYSLNFYNASTKNSYEIRIFDNTDPAKPVYKLLTLKAAAAVTTAGSDQGKAKTLVKQTYATTLTDSDKLKAALGHEVSDATDKYLEVKIRKLGDKDSFGLPGTCEAFDYDGIASATAFKFDGLADVGDNRLPIGVDRDLASAVKVGLGNDAAACDAANGATDSISLAAPNANVVIATTAKVAVVGKDTGKRTNLTTIAGKGFTFRMPSEEVDIVPVYDITATGVTSTIYSYTQDNMKDITKLSSLTGIAKNTYIYIELKDQMKLDFKDGNGDPITPGGSGDRIQRYETGAVGSTTKTLTGYTFKIGSNTSTEIQDLTIVESAIEYSISMTGTATAKASKTDSTPVDISSKKLKKGDSIYIIMPAGSTIASDRVENAIIVADMDGTTVNGYTLTASGTGNIAFIVTAGS